MDLAIIVFVVTGQAIAGECSDTRARAACGGRRHEAREQCHRRTECCSRPISRYNCVRQGVYGYSDGLSGR